MGSKAILMPAFLIASTSTISRKRERYMLRGSIVCDGGWALDCAPAWLEDAVCGFESKAAISRSMAWVASGSAGAPSGVENLMPLYSGGLWEAVKLMAPPAFD